MKMTPFPAVVTLLRYLLLTLVTCMPVTAASQSVPTNEEAFTVFVGNRLSQELPDFALRPSGRLRLEGKRPDGESTGQLNLERVYTFCARNTVHCSVAIDEYAKGVGEIVRDRMRPIDKSMVRLALRPQAYVSEIIQHMGASPAPIFARPFAADLAIVPVLDFTRSIRFVAERDLEKLGITEQELFQVAEQNLRTSLRPLAEVAPAPVANSIGRIGDEYASVRIVFHDDWSELAARLNQQLIVMVPAPDLLLYGSGATPVAIDALRSLGMEAARRSQRPLSPAVLRWTSAGWEQLK
jgi:hypothetical protein